MFKKIILHWMLIMTTIGSIASHADTMTQNKTTTGSSDTEITAQVKALYMQTPLIKNTGITIKTTQHIVMLTGKVDTDLQYEQAVLLAQSVNDVVDVNADKLLITKSKSPLSDTYITAKVKGIIMKEKLFGDKSVEYWPVSVETKDGVVFLTGIVDTEEQQKNIINLAGSIKGVKSVNSSLTIK